MQRRPIGPRAGAWSAALVALVMIAPSCSDEGAANDTDGTTATASDAENVGTSDTGTSDTGANAAADAPDATSTEAHTATNTGDAAMPAADPADEERALVERWLTIAREGTAVKRPQAAQRLGDMGEPAIEALRTLLADPATELEDLGPELLRPLAELGADDLREALWSAVVDPDFPYRPAATTWLAATAREGEWSRFAPLLDDPLSAVRAEAVVAIGTLDDRSLEPILDAALLDENDTVRRAAADLLVTWGHDDALRWLYEDLWRSDRFFELETGKTARYESARVLRRLLDDRALFGYQPREEPSSEANAIALAELGAAIEARIGAGNGSDAEARRPPAFALRSDVVVDGVLGLEIRSCRRGEYFVAVSADDRLIVGTAHPVEYQLEPGTANAIAALVEARLGAEDATLWGELGCDLECYRVLGSDEGTTRVLRVMKGPEEVRDLRPTPLDEVARVLVEAVPEGIEPGEAGDDLAQRLTDALRSVGGATR